MNLHRPNLKILTALLFALTLLGCATKDVPPASFYYILDAEPVVTNSANSIAPRLEQALVQAPSIKLASINIPGYLKQPNLVLKVSDHQIKLASYHFWAEDLSQSIQRVLINDLNSADNDFIYTTTCVKCDEITIDIEHFYPTQQGDVILSGTYKKINTDKQQSQVRFSFVAELETGGYDEAVATMRNLLAQLAQQIR